MLFVSTGMRYSASIWRTPNWSARVDPNPRLAGVGDADPGDAGSAVMTHSLRQSAVAESQTIGRHSRRHDHIPGSGLLQSETLT